MPISPAEVQFLTQIRWQVSEAVPRQYRPPVLVQLPHLHDDSRPALHAGCREMDVDGVVPNLHTVVGRGVLRLDGLLAREE